MRDKIADWDDVEKITIHTSHHTHHVIGTGSNDPQKFEPTASRETLDHSIMYIVAVALQDGVWHHVDSYTPQRASRADTVGLWRKIETVEDPVWTARYHAADPAQKAFGGRMKIRLHNGETLEDELAVANAHCFGAKPFARDDYLGKFATLAGDFVGTTEQSRFIDLCERLPQLSADEVKRLNVQLDPERMTHTERDVEGIF